MMSQLNRFNSNLKFEKAVIPLLPDFLAANRGHGKSKSLIHVFSVARQEADLLVPLEPYKFPIKGQRL